MRSTEWHRACASGAQVTAGDGHRGTIHWGGLSRICSSPESDPGQRMRLEEERGPSARPCSPGSAGTPVAQKSAISRNLAAVTERTDSRPCHSGQSPAARSGVPGSTTASWPSRVRKSRWSKLASCVGRQAAEDVHKSGRPLRAGPPSASSVASRLASAVTTAAIPHREHGGRAPLAGSSCSRPA